MKEECIICCTDLKKINDYIFKCKQCLFYKSILEPGFGRDIEGIAELRKNNFKKIIQVLLNQNKDNKFKILEIGSGNGFFLEECIKRNLDVTGSEADEDQYNKLKSKFSNIKKLSLPLAENTNDLEKYDYIVFNDVFEHLNHLDLVIDHIKQLLNKNGKVVINIPSSNGFIFKFSEFLYKIGLKNFYDRVWQKDLSSPHMSYFNDLNLKKLFEKNDFHQVHIDYLNTVSKSGNFKRLNSTIKSKLICLILSCLLFLFFYLQKIFPKDIIFHIYELKIKN